MSEKTQEISKALQRAQQVMDAFRDAAACPNATEQTLHQAVVASAQGHEVQFDLITGPRTAAIEGNATERALCAGDPLLLDLCLQQGAYWCDVCRTFFLGEPDDRVKQAYEIVLECFAMAQGMVCAQVMARDIYLAVLEFFAIRGMAGWMRHHTGHGIGHTSFEAPVEVIDSEDILCEGDVVTVEIGIYDSSAFGIRVEDDFLVTREGAQNLWDYPKALCDVILRQTSMEME